MKSEEKTAWSLPGLFSLAAPWRQRFPACSTVFFGGWIGVLVEYNDIRALVLGLKNNLVCGRYLQKCSCNLAGSRPRCVQHSARDGGKGKGGMGEPWLGEIKVCGRGVSPNQHDLAETQVLRPTESRKNIFMLFTLRKQGKFCGNLERGEKGWPQFNAP